MLNVPYFRQNRYYTCGPVCLRMVLAYWDHEADEVSLSMLCGTDVFGTSAKQIIGAAHSLGFEAEYKFKSRYSDLQNALKNGVPPIVAVNPNTLQQRAVRLQARHDIVLLSLVKNKILYHDPEVGQNLSIMPATFKEAWNEAQNEVILIWPVRKTSSKTSSK